MFHIHFVVSLKECVTSLIKPEGDQKIHQPFGSQRIIYLRMFENDKWNWKKVFNRKDMVDGEQD